MKRVFWICVVFFTVSLFSSCDSGGNGSSDSFSGTRNIGHTYMMWTDALHDLDDARVQRTAKALRNAGFKGFVVTYDTIDPRPYTVPPNTPFSALPRTGKSLGGRVIENFVCNYSWDRNGRSYILGSGGGYTDASLELAVSLTKQFYSGQGLLLSWEASRREAADWTFRYGKALRDAGVKGTFYYNLIGGAYQAGLNYPWADIGALPALSCGAGLTSASVILNEDGCNKPASVVPSHVLSLNPNRETWVWWEEGVKQHVGESLEVTANRIAELQ